MTTIQNTTQRSKESIFFLWQDAATTLSLMVQKESQYTLLDFASTHQECMVSKVAANTENSFLIHQQHQQLPSHEQIKAPRKPLYPLYPPS